MKGRLSLAHRRVPRPAQETPTGYRIPMARRREFFAFLAQVAESGVAVRPDKSRPRHDDPASS